MTVLPPGLTALPDGPPILEQHRPRPARPAERRRSPGWRVAFVALVVATVLAGASVLRDRSSTDADQVRGSSTVDLADGPPSTDG